MSSLDEALPYMGNSAMVIVGCLLFEYFGVYPIQLNYWTAYGGRTNAGKTKWPPKSAFRARIRHVPMLLFAGFLAYLITEAEKNGTLGDLPPTRSLIVSGVFMLAWLILLVIDAIRDLRSDIELEDPATEEKPKS